MKRRMSLTMGRATTIGFALCSLLLVACEPTVSSTNSKPRSDAVIASVKSNTAPQARSAEKAAASPLPKQDAALCKKGKFSLPQAALQSRGREGERLPPTLPGGQLLWVNIWAAWCEPCKKELPLLQKWQQQWQGSSREFSLVTISLDDDMRQLDKFLASSAALSVTYLLPEGATRVDWLQQAGLEEDPRLPVHLLVDREGEVFCLIDGSIEESDSAKIQELLEGAGSKR